MGVNLVLGYGSGYRQMSHGLCALYHEIILLVHAFVFSVSAKTGVVKNMHKLLFYILSVCLNRIKL